MFCYSLCRLCVFLCYVNEISNEVLDQFENKYNSQTGINDCTSITAWTFEDSPVQDSCHSYSTSANTKMAKNPDGFTDFELQSLFSWSDTSLEVLNDGFVCTHIWGGSCISAGAGEGDELMATFVNHETAHWRWEQTEEDVLIYSHVSLWCKEVSSSWFVHTSHHNNVPAT